VNEFTREEVSTDVVAFVASVIVLAAGMGLIFWYGRRRPADRPLTWGEAYVAGTFAFFMLFWAYGVVPHQWLSWADNELNWRADEFFLETYAIDVTKQAVRDIVVTGIYGALLGAHVFMWIWWQKRGTATAPEAKPSPYGRPLLKPQDQPQ
jgi:hypothetical protein